MLSFKPDLSFVLLGVLSLVNHALGQNFTNNLTCADNGKSYTDSAGYTYTVNCGVTFPNAGDDNPGLFFTLNPGNISNCIELCSDWNKGGPYANCTLAGPYDGGCYLAGGPVDLVSGDFIFSSLVGYPAVPPAAPISFNATCDADASETGNYAHYIDPDGFTYFTACGQQNSRQPTNQITSFEPQDITGCIKACSDDYLHCTDSGNCCAGIYYDPTNNACYFDSTSTPALYDGFAGDSAYRVATNRTCEYELNHLYSTPEGDNSYVYAKHNVDDPGLLSNTTQMTACGCAEQCSLYNRAFPNSTQCAGAEFDKNPTAKPNCRIKSV